MIATDDPDQDPVGLYKILNGPLGSGWDLIIRLIKGSYGFLKASYEILNQIFKDYSLR